MYYYYLPNYQINMSTFKAALTFKREFDPSEGTFEEITVQSQEQTDDLRWRFVTDSRKIRVFTGKCVEELLFTKEMFVAIVEVLQVIEAEIIKEFTKCLSQDMLTEWTNIRANMVPPILDDRDGFDRLIEEYIDYFAPDPDAKQTMINALEQKKHNFGFPHDKRGADVITFTQRIQTIFRYINELQGEPVAGLSVNRQVRLYFGLFRVEWQIDFKMMKEPDLNNATIKMIRGFMLVKQLQVEKQRKKDPTFRRRGIGNGNGNGNGNGKSDDKVPYSVRRNRNGNQYQHQRYRGNGDGRGGRYNNNNNRNGGCFES